ncbi:hypothetical protein ACEPAI_6279 [Sanghuangporus weigelae]
MPVPLTATAQHNQHQPFSRPLPAKNVKRKSSKPIINWLQRKLGGTVRARRPSETRDANGSADNTLSARATSLKELQYASVRNRAPAPHDVDENGHLVRGRPTSNQISLNSTTEMSDMDDEEDDMSNRRSSGAAMSMWGSRSNPVEADEDASIRPLPPTSPPSPSPSRSSSSYISSSLLSDPRTFKSMSASTKPTTLLSIDLTPGVAHIAQAPPTPTSVSAYPSGTSPITRRSPHVRTQSSGYNSTPGLITFSALPPSSPPSSRPSSVDPAVHASHGALQAPAHTHHHPRNNPRPSSPPLDNASVLTLASSAFATPLVERDYRARTASTGTPYTYTWAAGADTASHLSHLDGTGDSISQVALDGDEPNASMRALRPRSTRRDSWESEMSRWSAGVSVLGAFGPGGRDRSVRTAPSFRTGGQTFDIDECGSSCLIDEDVSSTKEDEMDEGDELRLEMKEDLERMFSPSSLLSVEGGASTSEEQDTRASESTEVDGTNVGESRETLDTHETDDALTPGPAARTLVLVPSKESIPLPERTSTPPPSVPSKDIETTPKKEKEVNDATS